MTFVILLAIGAVLAWAARAPLFAIWLLAVAAICFATALYVGWPIGEAVVATLDGAVVCQAGYIAGLCIRTRQ
jgi:hypothetical protein